MGDDERDSEDTRLQGLIVLIGEHYRRTQEGGRYELQKDGQAEPGV